MLINSIYQRANLVTKDIHYLTFKLRFCSWSVHSWLLVYRYFASLCLGQWLATMSECFCVAWNASLLSAECISAFQVSSVLKYSVTACLENPRMLGNFTATAVREMSGKLNQKLREVLEKKFGYRKLFIATFPRLGPCQYQGDANMTRPCQQLPVPVV